MTARWLLWSLIAVATALRMLCASSVGAYSNEAYYYMYAQHLDLSYFDHPPMVGVVSALGLRLMGSVAPIFGLRFGFVLLFAGSSWLMAKLTARWFGSRAAITATLALNTTIFFGLVSGIIASPDGPLLFFWLLTLNRLALALEKPEDKSVWWTVGLAWGGALLSKYHAVLLPVGFALYLLLRPSARRCLRMPGPYLATLTGLILFTPVIVWNVRHGSASFLFQGGRVGGFRGLQPATWVEALVAQALLLSPGIFAGLVIVSTKLLRRGYKTWSNPELFLVCQAVPGLVLFLGVATFHRIMPHWPQIGFVALFPLLGEALLKRLEIAPVRARREIVAIAITPAMLAFVFVIQAQSGLFQDKQGRLFGLLPPSADPTIDTVRWNQIARELKTRGLLNEPNTYLFTDYWLFSAELAMATQKPWSVACFNRDARSFTFWSDPTEWVGRDGIFVKVDNTYTEALSYSPWFTRIEPLAEFPIVRAGVPLQTVRLYRCVRQTDLFPFGYQGPGLIPRPEPRKRGDLSRPKRVGNCRHGKGLRRHHRWRNPTVEPGANQAQSQDDRQFWIPCYQRRPWKSAPTSVLPVWNRALVNIRTGDTDLDRLGRMTNPSEPQPTSPSHRPERDHRARRTHRRLQTHGSETIEGNPPARSLKALDHEHLGIDRVRRNGSEFGIDVGVMENLPR